MVATSITGIWHQQVYSAETPDWLAQTVGQDIANLFFMAPLLVLSSLFAARNNRPAKIIWTGAMLTNAYAFVIYCYGLHFNILFLAYCAVLGLSIYSLLYFALHHAQEDFEDWFTSQVPVKSTGMFLILMAALFFWLWLSSDVPAILSDRVPRELIRDGLAVNPVHVLDYTFFLPLLVISGIFLLQKKNWGFLLAPALLVFSICTDINIISLTVVGYYKHVVNDLTPVLIFTVFTLVCLGILWRMLRTLARSRQHR